jgi:hypothetical protein
MADRELIEIPISASGEIFTANKDAPVRGGGSRMVPLIPTPLGNCPCIWRSHTISEGAQGQPVYEGILLVSKNPPQTMRFQIDVDITKKSPFPMVPVEW